MLLKRGCDCQRCLGRSPRWGQAAQGRSGWRGRAPGCLPCVRALWGTLSPVAGCRSAPPHPNSSPLLSLQILQGLVDVRIPHNDFYRKRKCAAAAPLTRLSSRTPGARGWAVPGTVSPAAICPLHPPAALLRVGGENVINRFGDALWSLVATHWAMGLLLCPHPASWAN